MYVADTSTSTVTENNVTIMENDSTSSSTTHNLRGKQSGKGPSSLTPGDQPIDLPKGDGAEDRPMVRHERPLNIEQSWLVCQQLPLPHTGMYGDAVSIATMLSTLANTICVPNAGQHRNATGQPYVPDCDTPAAVFYRNHMGGLGNFVTRFRVLGLVLLKKMKQMPSIMIRTAKSKLLKGHQYRAYFRVAGNTGDEFIMVNKDVVTHRSRHVAGAFRGPWPSSKDKTVDFRDREAHVVKLYVHLLCKLAVFCEYIMDHLTKNLVNQIIIEGIHEQRADDNFYYPTRTAINYVYNYMKQKDCLRWLLADCCVYYADVTWLCEEDRDKYREDFLFDVMAGLAVRRPHLYRIEKILDPSHYQEEK
ncbi:hypothetical protein EK21DRAFT_92157 [Setomelanomma holmii]|uniref:Uncharacterized protein n=1 Tax=Setomelanomma holmii TaxID=210430 RepID=A0A9P4H472_9PLEO|nr:hypothetical protein EK21DRAFT_92157 [Setomelanomma holmii]